MAGSILKQERMLLLAIPAAIVAYLAEHAIFEAGKTAALIAAVALIGLIVLVSMRVAHHAEILATKVGDPYGTMILTLSAVAVEVLILAIIMSESSSPTLVRDTIYSAVMIDINGILGLAALLGGLRHGEQPYNDDSGKTYGVMILTAMGISMIVPEFIPNESWHVYSAFTIVAMIALYALFLKMQVGPHSYFFSYAYPRKAHPAGQASDGHAEEEDEGSVSLSIGLIIAGVVLIGVLAEFMSAFLSESLEGTSAPPASDGGGGGDDLGIAGNPHRAPVRLAQPHAGRGQYRHGRIAVDGYPDRARHGGYRALYRPAFHHGDDAGSDRHGLHHPHRRRHQSQ